MTGSPSEALDPEDTDGMTHSEDDETYEANGSSLVKAVQRALRILLLFDLRTPSGVPPNWADSQA